MRNCNTNVFEDKSGCVLTDAINLHPMGYGRQAPHVPPEYI